jgi:hypothetical protein
LARHSVALWATVGTAVVLALARLTGEATSGRHYSWRACCPEHRTPFDASVARRPARAIHRHPVAITTDLDLNAGMLYRTAGPSGHSSGSLRQEARQ